MPPRKNADSLPPYSVESVYLYHAAGTGPVRQAKLTLTASNDKSLPYPVISAPGDPVATEMRPAPEMIPVFIDTARRSLLSGRRRSTDRMARARATLGMVFPELPK